MKNENFCSQWNTYFERSKDALDLEANGMRASGLSDFVEGSWRD
jgi:hypothetical protein